MRTITVLLGRNQDFDAATTIITKHGGTRIEPTDAVMNDDTIEAEIPVLEWRNTVIALQDAGYDLD
jgi:hypothetical protein